MAKDIYENYEVARRVIDTFNDNGEKDLKKIMFGTNNEIYKAKYCQLGVFRRSWLKLLL